MKTLHIIAFILLIVGGLNWLLVAFNWNLVEALFGSWPMLVTIIYVLVGLSAILIAATHGKDCRMCKGGGSM
jgi:uncharacterized membrane protein YuzA (DUF378 family)